MQNDKEIWRQQFRSIAAPTAAPGKLAEVIRAQACYRRSKTLFVAPAPLLQQVRINALLDGKILLMPGPALKKGFYLLRPYTVAFKDLGYAVTLKGLEGHGRPLDVAGLAELRVDLALTDCLAVDGNGGRLGHGTGFFDLAMAILAELEAVGAWTLFGAIGGADQLVDAALAQDPWDVAMHFLCHGQGVQQFAISPHQPVLCWDRLPKKRIRKSDLLWQLYQARFPSP